MKRPRKTVSRDLAKGRKRPPARGRPRISSLSAPHPRFDVTKTPGFELEPDVVDVDRRRARRLRWQARTYLNHRKALLALADRIDPDVTRHPDSLASSRFMRSARIRVIGALWELIYNTHPYDPRWVGAQPVSTFTVVSENSSVPLGRLSRRFEGVRYMDTFRGHLNRVMRAMGGNPGGMLFACLHGAYDPTTGSFLIHIHGVATGPMIRVVNGLRALNMYAPAQPFDGRDAANTPIVMSQRPLFNMPDPLTYHGGPQRWWPLRETYLDTDGLRKAYGGKRKGIRGPAEAEYLLFLDRCRLEDITLLMGMHVTRDGLVAR